MQTQKPAYVPFQPDQISAQSAQLLMNTLARAINDGIDEIHLMLSSDGGLIKDGFTIYQYLRSLPIPVYTYNMGHVESIANVIYQAGVKRICLPDSRFMIHGFHWTTPALLGIDGLLDQAQSLKLSEDTFADVMMRHTKLSQEQIQNMLNRTTFMNPQEAFSYGMVDEVRAVEIPEGVPILPLI